MQLLVTSTITEDMLVSYSFQIASYHSDLRSISEIIQNLNNDIDYLNNNTFLKLVFKHKLLWNISIRSIFYPSSKIYLALLAA